MVPLCVGILGRQDPENVPLLPPPCVCVCVHARGCVSVCVHVAEDAQGLWLTKQSLPKHSLVSTWPQQRNFPGPLWGGGSRAGRRP